MNPESENTNTHGGKEDVMERDKCEELDRLIFSAIACSAAASESDDTDFPAVLADADLAAFKALGTGEEVANRVMARVRAIEAARNGRASTFMGHHAIDETSSESAPDDVIRDPEFETLLAKHRACHDLKDYQLNYRFVREMQEIGQGGQGIVYRAKCEDEFVGSLALKILSPEPYPNAASYRQDMERMRAVAAVVHQNCPSNLICVEDFAPHDDVYVMFMRLIDGFDLQRLLEPGEIERLRRSVDGKRWSDLKEYVFAALENGQWGLKPGVAVNIIEKCLWGLQALHEKEIVHCDIKPSNIMLDCYGSIRIIDIGSAYQLGSPPRRPSWTPRYAPPEVLEKGEWSKHSDLASVGYVLIELLSGRSALIGPTVYSTSVHGLDKDVRAQMAKGKRQLYDRLHDLIPEKARQSPCLMELLRKLIHPNPEHRFESAEQAFDLTANFRDELAKAGLAMAWVKVTKHWVIDVKKSVKLSGDRGPVATGQ